MREKIEIRGINAETKNELKKLALARFGKANISLFVRHLIDRELAAKPQPIKSKINFDEPMIRVETRVPASALEAVEKLADDNFSTRNYFINSLIYRELGRPQLTGIEIEVLRRSNYEISKIGTNINQITREFNTVAMALREGTYKGERLPETGKKLASLKKDISTHIQKVLRVLNEKTVVLETKGKGSNSKKTRKDQK